MLDSYEKRGEGKKATAREEDIQGSLTLSHILSKTVGST